jgi:hypothetical protein
MLGLCQLIRTFFGFASYGCYLGFGLGGVHTFTESLILAQDERWRRA